MIRVLTILLVLTTPAVAGPFVIPTPPQAHWQSRADQLPCPMTESNAPLVSHHRCTKPLVDLPVLARRISHTLWRRVFARLSPVLACLQEVDISGRSTKRAGLGMRSLPVQ